MRVKVGIKDLDEKLEGGLPENSSVLVIGGVDFGKTILCNQFIYQGLKQGEAAIYISFEAPPKKIRDQMKKFGWDIEGKIIIFIDAYSWKTGGVENKYAINDIADLNEFIIKVLEAIRELTNKNLKRSAVDCLSELFTYIPSDLALKFITNLLAKLEIKAKTTQLLTLEKGVHEPNIVASLEMITDGTIDLDMRENERFLRLTRMKDIKSSEWMKFEITDKGIILK